MLVLCCTRQTAVTMPYLTRRESHWVLSNIWRALFVQSCAHLPRHIPSLTTRLLLLFFLKLHGGGVFCEICNLRDSNKRLWSKKKNKDVKRKGIGVWMGGCVLVVEGIFRKKDHIWFSLLPGSGLFLSKSHRSHTALPAFLCCYLRVFLAVFRHRMLVICSRKILPHCLSSKGPTIPQQTKCKLRLIII